MDTIVSVTPMVAGSSTCTYRLPGDDDWDSSDSAIIIALLRDDVIFGGGASDFSRTTAGKRIIKTRSALIDECINHLRPKNYEVSNDGKSLTIYYAYPAKRRNKHVDDEQLQLLGAAWMRLRSRIDITIAQLFPSMRDQFYQALGLVDPELLAELQTKLDGIPDDQLANTIRRIVKRSREAIRAEVADAAEKALV